MKIDSYYFSGEAISNIVFDRVRLRNINLLVGDTGTGKTKFLNTIFNLGRGAVSDEGLKNGQWELSFSIKQDIFEWSIETLPNPNRKNLVKFENLTKIAEDGKKKILVNRTPEVFEYKGNTLPKLPRDVCSINLLKDEGEIAPIYRGFSSIMRRYFSQDEMTRNANYQTIPTDLVNQTKGIKKIDELFPLIDLSINVRLYFLSLLFKDTFSHLVGLYKGVFPFIVDIAMKDLSELHPKLPLEGYTPVFCVKEKNVKNWIEYKDLSSGMQKVLLILTDTILLPEGGIYLIDEYENSLGVNSIDFFPSYLLSEDNPHQFIITSHHPYLINKIPSNNWFVFHRDGSNIYIMYGDQLKERFGKSKQQAFLQLINDQFYTKGIQQN